MDNKTKLYVFAKKEVALIFVLMILIAITSFVLGVKFGKTYAFKAQGLIEVKDPKAVDLLSQDEEEVKDLVTPKVEAEVEHAGAHADPHASAGHDDPHASAGHAEKKETAKGDSTYEKLQAEYGKLKSMPGKAGAREKTEEEVITEKKNEMPNFIEDEKVDSSKLKSSLSSDKGKAGRDEFSGKFTVQIGSHRSRQEAEKFADGFRIRGYEPIISEVNIAGKGMWYRVSLGAFKTIVEAKEFISKEKTLLQEEDYIIARFE